MVSATLGGATDGGAALQKICDKNYGMVISDFYMEPMSSLQLLTEIRIDAELTGVSPGVNSN